MKKIIALMLSIMLMIPVISVDVKASEAIVTSYGDLLSAISDDEVGVIIMKGSGFAWPSEETTFTVPDKKTIYLEGDLNVPSNVTINIGYDHPILPKHGGRYYINVYGNINASGVYDRDSYNLLYVIKEGGSFNISAGSEYYTWEPLVIENGGTLNCQGILGLKANSMAMVMHYGCLEISTGANVYTGSNPATSYILGVQNTWIRGNGDAIIHGNVAIGSSDYFNMYGNVTVDNLEVDHNPLRIGSSKGDIGNITVKKAFAGTQNITVYPGSTLTFDGTNFAPGNSIDLYEGSSLILTENVKTIDLSKGYADISYSIDNWDDPKPVKIELLGTLPVDKATRSKIPDKVINDSSTNIMVVDDHGHHVYDPSDASRCVWCDGYALTKQTITTGANSYTKSVGDAKFNLNAKAKTSLFYFSDDSSVCDVDYTGKVTINGAGTATIIIIANEENGYVGVRKEITVTVKPAAFKSATLSATSFFATGSAKKPTVTVKNSTGTVLKKDTHYTVTYSNNVKPGTAKVTIKGKGAYAGKSLTKTFTIKVKPTTLKTISALSKGFKVTWTKQTSANVSGYKLQYSTSSSMSSPKNVMVSGASSYTKSIKKLKASKKYFVRIRTYKTISGTKYYSAWSAKKYVTTKK